MLLPRPFASLYMGSLQYSTKLIHIIFREPCHPSTQFTCFYMGPLHFYGDHLLPSTMAVYLFPRRPFASSGNDYLQTFTYTIYIHLRGFFTSLFRDQLLPSTWTFYILLHRPFTSVYRDILHPSTETIYIISRGVHYILLQGSLTSFYRVLYIILVLSLILHGSFISF